jgi:integrase
VLPVGKIRRLLEAALERDPGLLPLLLVETLCGVRPAEASRILWTDIDLLRKRLTIRAIISKTDTARPIELSPCALAWFQTYAALPDAQTTDPIAPWSESFLRSRLRKVRYHAGYRRNGAKWTAGALLVEASKPYKELLYIANCIHMESRKDVQQKLSELATEPDRWFTKLKSFVGTEPDLDLSSVYLGKD